VLNLVKLTFSFNGLLNSLLYDDEIMAVEFKNEPDNTRSCEPLALDAISVGIGSPKQEA